jgi:hypothetical protein
MGRPIETGFAIGALGFAAVIMTARADRLTKAEQIVWIVIAFVLFIAEVRVIDQDRIQQDREHRAELLQQKIEFGQTMDEFSKTNNDEANHFEALLDREVGIFQGVQKASRDTEDALTGGDSFVTVTPVWATDPGGSDFPLMIGVVGRNTMYDVNIEMQEGQPDAQYFISHIQEYLRGTLRPSFHFLAVSTTYLQPLGKEIHPDPAKINEYHFWVFSRTKATTESLQVKVDPKTKQWVVAYQVSRDDMKLPMFAIDFDGKITRRPPPKKR